MAEPPVLDENEQKVHDTELSESSKRTFEEILEFQQEYEDRFGEQVQLSVAVRQLVDDRFPATPRIEGEPPAVDIVNADPSFLPPPTRTPLPTEFLPLRREIPRQIIPETVTTAGNVCFLLHAFSSK